MLANPDGDNAGEPWVYLDEQALFILWFYAVDEFGRYLYRNAVLERPKGWGKSPLLAAICCTEFMGPVTFSHFNKITGAPVGRPTPTPLVQIAAISDSQAENTYALCREMMLGGPLKRLFPKLEIMLAKSTYPGGRKLEKVTASPRGREGNRATFVVMDETHLWVPAEQGIDLYEALTRNLVKMNKRHIETTNAPVPGEGSVAEKTHEAYERMVGGKTVDKALLFDTREVAIDNIYDKDKAYKALKYVYGDAADPVRGHINLDRIWAEINDPRTREPVARRFYFNQRVRPPSAWLKYEEWMKCRRLKLKLRNGDKIALGFKGTVNTTAAALVGCRLEDGALFNLGLWEKPQGSRVQKEWTDEKGEKHRTDERNWQANWEEIDARVRNILDNYNVAKLLADPVSRRDVISKWYADYPKVIEEFWFSNKGKHAKLVQQFERGVTAKRVLWENQDICRHVLNCHTEEVPGGFIIRQETPGSSRYISMAQASLLAVEAAALAIQDGALDTDDKYMFSF
jgi:phage terminase large subunit-like protein